MWWFVFEKLRNSKTETKGYARWIQQKWFAKGKMREEMCVSVFFLLGTCKIYKEVEIGG